MSDITIRAYRSIHAYDDVILADGQVFELEKDITIIRDNDWKGVLRIGKVVITNKDGRLDIIWRTDLELATLFQDIDIESWGRWKEGASLGLVVGEKQ